MTTDLKPHADRVSQTSLKTLADARASSAPLRAAGWSIDLSRHYLDAEAEAGLLQFGRVSDLQSAADSLFAGDIVNPSERRPALHWALRAQSELSGEAETVRQSVLPALSFARDVVSGSVTSSTGLPFNAVLHIGIGGSDFGPRLIVDAFEDKASGNIDLRFCANVDPFDLDRAMHGLDPTRTLVIG
ncbi:MAG TPA: glucose-6-phosphate isomerase, partial [Hyphomonas sp.]|nr:glucose-6-phosphate isomerase [Hyphomonas sp.]HBL93093.1 glucose-6-phosphate isomerase [Hyphomonas sp.]HCN92652.1 glucose-6-phosphate isomerase [Hyphomonas sp.]